MRTWIYLLNPFITATNENYAAMKKISSFTFIALSTKLADPFFAALHTALQPFVGNFNKAHNKWLTEMGQQMGSSASLTQLLGQLRSEKIRDWDIAIQNVYKDGTPEYIALFPHHREPFQQGAQMKKLGAVEALETAIGNDADLAVVKADVVAFNTLLKAAYKAQKGKINTTTSNSADVEAARIALAMELYSTLGKLMAHFKENPEQVAIYFDLETIRNHQQKVFKGSLKGGELVLALTHTFAAGDNIKITNRGKTDLKVALLEEVNGTITTVFVTVAANSHKTYLSTDLGNIATNRYLKILNTSATEAGAYTVELV